MTYKLMIVDDNISNLIMAQKALEEEYEVLPVSSGLSALECLGDMPDLPDLVILDIDMPNVNGFQVISEMKNIRKLKNIPIIFLTAQDDATTELESYNLGAIDYIRKPYTASLLRKRINVQIQLLEQRRKLEEVNTLLTTVIQGQRKKDILEQFAIVDMIHILLEQRNEDMALHANRVEKYMAIFTKAITASPRFNLADEEVKAMSAASRMHDIGKLGLKDIYAAYEPAESNPQYDKATARMHTVIGADAVKKLMATEELASTFASYACNMCRSHHEKFDGTGYPDRLAGDEIPLEARILAIINNYDNFRTMKKNGNTLDHSEACAKVSVMKNKFFDPVLVDIFLKNEKEFADVVS